MKPIYTLEQINNHNVMTVTYFNGCELVKEIAADYGIIPTLKP